MAAHQEIDPRLPALVRADNTIKNHQNESMTFNLSPELLANAFDKRHWLSMELGLSPVQSIRDREIMAFRDQLSSGPNPYWKIGRSDFKLAPSPERHSIDTTGAAYEAELATNGFQLDDRAKSARQHLGLSLVTA